MSDLLAAGDVVVQIADPNHSSIVLTAWGTVAAAVAAGATFIVAMSIGRQASKIADSQRAIAGMNILRDTYNDLFCSPHWRTVRRDFINAWLEQRPVDAYARQVLNFFEDVGVFLQKDWVGDDVAYELLSAWVLHYWDASAPFVATESAIAPDSWDKTAEMVDTFHKLAGASAFARTCTPQMITRFFRRELAELDTFDDSHA